MAIFDRIRRARRTDAAPEPEPVPEHLLPEVNQRVTISAAGSTPVSSRVEDLRGGMVQLADPSIDLEFGDAVTLTWERDDVWFTLATRLTGIDRHAAVPMVQVAGAGRLSRFDERRLDTPREIEFPVELRVVRSRSVRAGRELTTRTTHIGADMVRFLTTAQFAPGDLIEATIHVGELATDAVRARMRVIRTDTAAEEWRSTCTVTFDEVLRTDRARLMAIAAATGVAADATPAGTPQIETTPVEPTTPDGVGGRDEPRSLSDLQGVLDWLARDRVEQARRSGEQPNE